MNPKQFVQALCDLEFEDVFNPYSNRCSVNDRPSAPDLRRRVLHSLLTQAEGSVESIWLGRDLGYRGGRRTGLALTDDVNIGTYVSRWGLRMQRPTKGPPVAERTAAVIWSVLALIKAPVFLWNVFPLHPHMPGDSFSNRAHNSRERKVGEEVLATLLAILKPKRIVAIGNDAGHAAARVANGQSVICVRHPSYGGQNQFLAQVRSLYALSHCTHNPFSSLAG